MLTMVNSVTSILHPIRTTWTLWYRLLHPPAHPLFWRTIYMSPSGLATPVKAWVMALVSSLACTATWMLTTQVSPTIAILLFVALILFSSSFYVIPWILGINAAIAREHEHSTYEPLSLPPSGALGASWAICAANLHRNDALHWIDLTRKLLTGLLLCIFLLILLATATRPGVFSLDQFLRLLFDMIAIAAASYLDHVQSIIFGSLIGMLTPVYNRHRVDSYVWPVLVFLAVQLFTILGAFLINLVIFPGLCQLLNLPDWFATISPPLIGLLAFYLMREGFISAAWRMLIYQLNATLTELDFSD